MSPSRGVLRRVAGTAILALVTAAPAAAQSPEHFEFTASPAQAGRPLTLQFTLGTTAPLFMGQFGVDLPSGTVWNGRSFPKCSFKRLVNARTLDECPRRSRVGSGKATAVHAFLPEAIEHARVTAINGGGALHLMWEGTISFSGGRTLDRTLVWRGRSQNEGDVTEWIPASGPFEAPGLIARLEEFKLKIGKTLRNRGIIEISRCRTGRWKATGTIEYFSGPAFEETHSHTGRARDSVRCTP